MSGSVNRKSLSEQAYESIRDDIIHIRLEPGQMVYESELSESLGMSRTPMREAFRMLAGEELIEVLPQRGVRICLISERKVEEARFVRESLEISAIRLTTQLWNEKVELFKRAKQQILQLLEEQRQAVRESDMIRFLQYDEAFHRALLLHSGNQTLVSVVSHMRGHLNRLRYLSLREIHGGDQLIAEHESLFEAVTRNDEKVTVRILEKHLRKLNYDLPSIKVLHPHYFKSD